MSSYDVIGIGNAIVDVISHAPDTFLGHMGIEKGIMQLVERDRAEVLYAAMSDRREVPGGSVANSLAGLGELGLACGFTGRVANDSLGQFYANAMEVGGTSFLNAPVNGGELPTSRSMIFVSPDGERSMNTYLGISAELSPGDVDTTAMSKARFLFLEGYLFDKDLGKQAFEAAAQACRSGGGRPGITLSDPFCVDRHRGDFKKLIDGPMDWVIGNEAEWLSLYETDDLNAALSAAASACDTVVCTRSGDPVILKQHSETVEVPVTRVTPVDATGAGDQFAAGFLFGLATNRTIEVCGRMGVLMAAEVISHIGPRPESDLLALLRAEGLI
ncbi:adenosine kinase [Litoreibacter roseus]|uniref:Adenosine kinase n=1 Tax=Litoreibacter roseus TaxID=2601869 RepID=A0A6N6JAP4_9RHOB|nr:adenosine kinase [Litoreibacter roseus]GFE63067.1 adenosine kinase [Litoreibacter roseus]